jgi:hypothetical protein
LHLRSRDSERLSHAIILGAPVQSYVDDSGALAAPPTAGPNRPTSVTLVVRALPGDAGPPLTDAWPAPVACA